MHEQNNARCTLARCSGLLPDGMCPAGYGATCQATTIRGRVADLSHGTPAGQLHRAAIWYLEERSPEALEALAAAASRYELEGDELAQLVQEAVQERDQLVGRDGLPVSDWHARARKALTNPTADNPSA